METNIIHDVLLLLTGFIVGSMNAIAGGGMLVGFPVLIALGIPALYANATANVATLPGQLASAFGYRKYVCHIPRQYTLLLLPVVVGAAGGALVLRHTSAGRFNDLIPLLLLFGVILFTVQPLLHFHLHRHVTGASRDWLPMVLLGIVAIPLSFYGGYFGAGYGFMMLAFLGFTNMSDTHMMNGMKNVAATFVAATSITCLANGHFIHWHVGIVMAAGSLVGGYVGARNAQRLSHHRIRIAIICVGLVAVFLLTLHAY